MPLFLQGQLLWIYVLALEFNVGGLFHLTQELSAIVVSQNLASSASVLNFGIFFQILTSLSIIETVRSDLVISLAVIIRAIPPPL